MGTEVVEGAFAGTYRSYEHLLAAVGLSPDEEALAGFLGRNQRERNALLALMEEDEEAWAEQSPAARTKLRELLERAEAQVRDCLPDPPADTEALTEALRALPEEKKDAVADALLRQGHSRFLEPRYISAEAFRAILNEHHDPEELALVKFVPHLRRRLQERGFELTNGEVRRLFQPDCDRRVPYCLKRILREADGEFDKGLIPLEDMVGDRDPDEWLEEVRAKLLFRSHSSLHKAIADATSQKYDCIHKALSGRDKANRIQAEIKYCIERWLRRVEEGLEIDVSDDYRGVPVEWTCELMPELQKHFDSKEAVYRAISEETDIKAGSVRRYFQKNSQLKHAPLAVYRLAKELAGGGGEPLDKEEKRGESYLRDAATRRAAQKLADEVNEAYRRWQRSDDDPELHLRYRELRRALIVTIKEQHTALPVAV